MFSCGAWHSCWNDELWNQHDFAMWLFPNKKPCLRWTRGTKVDGSSSRSLPSMWLFQCQGSEWVRSATPIYGITSPTKNRQCCVFCWKIAGRMLWKVLYKHGIEIFLPQIWGLTNVAANFSNFRAYSSAGRPLSFGRWLWLLSLLHWAGLGFEKGWGYQSHMYEIYHKLKVWKIPLSVDSLLGK